MSGAGGGSPPREPDPSQLASALQDLLGYRLLAWEPDRAVIGYTVDSAHMNRVNRLHGGVLATLLDAVCGFAGSFAIDAVRPRTCMTLSITVNFVGSVTGGALVAEGRRTGGGRTIFFAQGEVRDEAGFLVASASGAFRYVPAPSLKGG